MNPYISKYIKLGFKIFACLPNKAPATLNGFYDATDDIAKLEKQFHNDDFLIGLPTGKVNKIVVLDFDVGKKIPGTDITDPRTVDDLIEAVKEYGDLPNTLQVATPSGGRHMVYTVPEDIDLKSAARFFDNSLPVDIRANGGYVCAPDGKNYIVYDDVNNLDIDGYNHAAPLLEWIKAFQKKVETTESSVVAVIPPSEIKEIRSALSFIDADNRDMWIKIGMALKSLGNSMTARGLWDEWSKQSPKFDPLDQTKHWNEFKPKSITIASLFHESKKNGWITTYENKLTIVPPTEKEQIAQAVQNYQRKLFPRELLYPGGLVEDIANYITDISIRPQPIFSLAAGLCAVGTIAARKYQTARGARTNLYCLCVGVSGCGKESPRRILKKIFQSVNCHDMVKIEDIASDAAMTTQLKKQPAQLFLLDEIGRFLTTTVNAIKSPHLYNIVSFLLRLDGTANQTISGKAYADDDKNAEIIQPNVCLYGTTVPHTLYQNLKYDNAINGFLPRMCIFETDTPRVKINDKENQMMEPPKEIIDQLLALKAKPINTAPRGNLDGERNPLPYVVPYTGQAKQILADFYEHIDNLTENLRKGHNKPGIDALYSRTCEIASRIALIIAIGKNIDTPVIDEDTIKYAIKLAQYLSDYSYYVVTNFVAENQYAQDVQDVLNFIRHAGSVTYSDITRHTQHVQGRLRNDIIKTLIDSQFIEEYIQTGENNKISKKWYVPAKQEIKHLNIAFEQKNKINIDNKKI